jgi:hypothetical protein
MTQTYDHYAACHELAACLQVESLPEWHERLENAIADGATATEILMAIRFILRDLLGRSPTMTKSTKDRANTLLTEVDKSLA